MEKAKKAVSNFLSKDGKHDTTIDQEVRDPIVKEQVRPQRHEEVTTAIDREIHQDHHQTVVQPLSTKEVLPEQHTHNMVAVGEKSVDKSNDKETRATLEQDAAKYTSERQVLDTEYSTSAAGTVLGERTHHHVHHHVQPVIQKETVQPEVVHTTIPVHETHQAAPIHHETTVLPVKTMDEFLSSQGGAGGAARDLKAATPRQLAQFDGCPNLKDKSLKGFEAVHSQDAGGKEAAAAGQNLQQHSKPAKMGMTEGGSNAPKVSGV